MDVPTEPLVISADDLAALKAATAPRSQLIMQLGALEYQRRQIESEIEELMPKFAASKRDFHHHFNRIRTKYGLPETAQIDETTGEVR